MKIQEKDLSKHKGKVIFSAIWLLLGLWFMVGVTAEATNGLEMAANGDLIYQAEDHLWYHNLPAFLLAFVAPVAATWGISHWRNKSQQ